MREVWDKPILMNSVLLNSPDIAGRHFLAVRGLSPSSAEAILDLAESYSSCTVAALRQKLAGRTQIQLFMETSTRTQTSFELAGKRLGADVINMRPASLAIKKGETLIDTALTLNAMRPDLLIIRHQNSGVAALIARKVDCSVVNAGDGAHEHPTQALADALTIRRRCGRISGLRIAICGDIIHSRVARSNIHLLTSLGAKVRLVGPQTLMPPPDAFPAKSFSDLEECLAECDIVMLLRLQRERMHGGFVPSEQEYFRRFGLTRERLAAASGDVLVMHPGPMNRGVEIDGDVADDVSRSLISPQVEAGVSVRMAVLDLLINGLINGKTAL